MKEKITTLIKNANWSELLQFCLPLSSQGQFVVKGSAELSPAGQKLLEALQGQTIKISPARGWPGALQSAPASKIYRFAFNRSVKDTILQFVPLSDLWAASDFPEDFALFAKDGDSVLTYRSSTKECEIHLDGQQLAQFKKLFPDVS